MLLPWLLADSVRPSTLVFIIVYGLDWVATVPPTIALCRERYGDRASVVFGWVFASHQIGAAFAAVSAGVLRDQTGSYTLAWYAAGTLCLGAAVMSAWIPRHRAAGSGDQASAPLNSSRPSPLPTTA
jgi:predicted MFS family arabinose efflux permease